MSTRCRIGIENKKGEVASIYCHHDGYLDVVGKVLVNHYKTQSKIMELMRLGDISSIGTEPVSNPQAWDKPDFANWREQHPENMCDTYASRGEDAPARIDKDVKTYIKKSSDSWAEFIYLFKNGKWYYIESGETEDDLREVEAKL